jgi:hypothetical protein
MTAQEKIAHRLTLQQCGKSNIERRITSAKPVGCVSYGGPDAISNAIGHAQFVLLSWFGTPCVLAIPPSP